MAIQSRPIVPGERTLDDPEPTVQMMQASRHHGLHMLKITASSKEWIQFVEKKMRCM